MNKRKYSLRYLARIVIEAQTPLAVISGERHMLADAVVVRDVNQLPYIPGTAIVGVVRAAVEKSESDALKTTEFIFGNQASKTETDKHEGSKIAFTAAHFVTKGGLVLEGVVDDLNSENDEFVSSYYNLPIREHVHINEKGTAEHRGKFDTEVVFKGTRFCFEIEMYGQKEHKNEEKKLFQNLLNILQTGDIRLGSKTRSGLGAVRVIDCKAVELDLEQEDCLNAYIDKTASLNDDFWMNIKLQPLEIGNSQHTVSFTTYELHLKPDNFFMFGGAGNKEANMSPVNETMIEWDNWEAKPVIQCTLIPASSVKGALSHRVAFHYNKMNGHYAVADNCIAKTGADNEAVRELFGFVNDKRDDEAQCGKVIFSDVIQHDTSTLKLLNHVAIDRFTGGAISGALFTEQVTYAPNEEYVLTIKVVNNVGEDSIKAFELALKDVVTGMLPLGGGTNRGHGCFSGTILKNGELMQ